MCAERSHASSKKASNMKSAFFVPVFNQAKELPGVIEMLHETDLHRKTAVAGADHSELLVAHLNAGPLGGGSLERLHGGAVEEGPVEVTRCEDLPPRRVEGDDDDVVQGLLESRSDPGEAHRQDCGFCAR